MNQSTTHQDFTRIHTHSHTHTYIHTYIHTYTYTHSQKKTDTQRPMRAPVTPPKKGPPTKTVEAGATCKAAAIAKNKASLLKPSAAPEPKKKASLPKPLAAKATTASGPPSPAAAAPVAPPAPAASDVLYTHWHDDCKKYRWFLVCVCTICIDVKLHYAAGACGTHVLPRAMKLWT